MAHARPKDRAVLDTSLFVNPDVRSDFGKTPTEALIKFLELAGNAPSVEFYMPPIIFEELMNFVDMDKVPRSLWVYLRQKPPKRYEIPVPGFIFYELMEDMRERVNKGLRIAEKAVKSAASKPLDECIQDLRRKYRDALREGVIDSKEDVELILLARELDAVLVTADQGAIKWAEKLGIRWLVPERLKDFIEGHAEAAKAGR